MIVAFDYFCVPTKLIYSYLLQKLLEKRRKTGVYHSLKRAASGRISFTAFSFFYWEKVTLNF